MQIKKAGGFGMRVLLAIQIWGTIALLLGGPVVHLLTRIAPTMKQGTWDVLMGVVLGGLITTMSSVFVNLVAERRREKNRRLALAHSIVFKLQVIVSLLVQVRAHAFKSRRMADEKRWPLWRAMTEFFGTEGERIAFNTDELALFTTNDQASFAGDLRDIERAYNLVVALVNEYNARRDSFSDDLGDATAVSITGETASFETTDGRAKLRAHRLEQFASSIERIAGDAAAQAIEMSNIVGGKLVALLDDKRYKMLLILPTEPPERPDRVSHTAR